MLTFHRPGADYFEWSLNRYRPGLRKWLCWLSSSRDALFLTMIYTASGAAAMINCARRRRLRVLYHSSMSDKLNTPTYFTLLIATPVKPIIMQTRLSRSQKTVLDSWRCRQMSWLDTELREKITWYSAEIPPPPHPHSHFSDDKAYCKMHQIVFILPLQVFESLSSCSVIHTFLCQGFLFHKSVWID